VESLSFERWLRAIPPVLDAVLITGDVAAVVHHEVAGLIRHGRTNSNGVTLRRQRTM
jgi:hypothetical protein